MAHLLFANHCFLLKPFNPNSWAVESRSRGLNGLEPFKVLSSAHHKWQQNLWKFVETFQLSSITNWLKFMMNFSSWAGLCPSIICYNSCTYACTLTIYKNRILLVTRFIKKVSMLVCGRTVRFETRSTLETNKSLIV